MAEDHKTPARSPRDDSSMDQVTDLPERDAGDRDDQVRGGAGSTEPLASKVTRSLSSAARTL